MMIYPLYLENRDTPAKLPLLAKSVARWVDTAMTAGQGAGYLLSGAASFHAAFGDGDAALDSLQALIGGKDGIGRKFTQPIEKAGLREGKRFARKGRSRVGRDHT